MTWLRGTHSLKFGADIRRVDYQDMIAPASLFGSIDFTGRFTGQPYADFLLGLPNTASRACPPVPALRRRGVYDFFVQDDWKVGRNLTVNLGLRYDLHPGWVEREGRLAFFDRSRNTRSQSIPAQVPRRSAWPSPMARAIPSAQIDVHIGTSAASRGW